MRVTHTKTSNIVDNGNPAQVQPSDWDADHQVEVDAVLALLAALTPAPDKLPYFSDANTAALTTLTAFARTLLATTSAPALAAAIGAVALSGGTMTGPLTLSGDPTQALQATTKQYVDNALTGWDAKQSVRVASTANVSIATPGTAIDGITLANGDRVLLKNQTAPAQNGIYIFNGSASAMTRATDFDAWSEIPGSQCLVEEGTANADSGWVCSANQGGTLGTTAITFSQFFGTGLFQAASAILSTLAGISSAANLTALAGLTGAANKVPSFTGVGAMALLTVGLAASNLVQLDGSAKLPAVDGSQLTNLPTSPPAGQAYLSVSGGNLLLSRKRGSQICINGTNQLIPSAGVTLAATGITTTNGVGGGPMQYIYAFMNSGTMTLERSTTASAIDTTTGVQIKSGDATRTLVGIWCASGSATWSTVATEGASWFNPEEKSANSGLNSPNTVVTSMAFITSAIAQPFVSFAGRNVRYAVRANMSQTVATASMILDLGLDASATGNLLSPINAQGSGTGDVVSSYASGNSAAFSEGRHTLTPIGFTSTGQTNYTNLSTEVVIWG